MRRSRGGLPTFVKIGHLTYKIRSMTRKVADKEQAYADIGIEDGTIRVQEGLPPALTAEKLLHEILHGTIDAWDIDADDEERIVTALAKGLAAVMRDNPHVMRWMLKQLKPEPLRAEA